MPSLLRPLVVQALIGDGRNPWADRVVETAAAMPDLQLPWITGGVQPWLLVQGGTTGLAATGQRATFIEVWPFGEMSQWQGIDNLEAQVTAILDQAVLHTPATAPQQDGYLVTYDSSPLGDQVVQEWDAYTRPVRFSVAQLAWFGPDDPRAMFLRAQDASLFCLDPTLVTIQTDPASWVPTDASPGVYWRPDTGPAEVIRYPNLTLYQETLALHVICPTRKARDLWCDRFALGLPGDVLFIEPNVADGGTGVPPRRSTMFLNLAGTNLYAEPWTDGQIRVTAQFSELVCGFDPETEPKLVQATVELDTVRQIGVAVYPSDTPSPLPPPPPGP